MIDRDDGQVIPDYYATNIENWLIRDRGELEMRKGITARGSSPSQTNLGAGVLYQAGQPPLHVRVINGAANSAKFQQSYDNLTWTDISGGGSRTTDRQWHFVQAANALYAVNGVDTAVKITTSALSTIAAIPLGNAIEWWKNVLWVFAVDSVPDRLYYSDANTPETFGGASFINVNLGDSSRGVGLKGTAGGTTSATVTGRLYVGKQRSVWFISGSTSSDFALNVLTYEHGVVAHESMVNIKNDVWCIDIEGNIRGLYRSSTDNPFTALRSRDIQLTIAGLNKSALYKSSGVFFDNYAMFFVANGVDDYNSLVLVWDTLANEKKGGWIKFTNWNINRAVIFQDSNTPKLFLHDARVGNGQTYEWAGTADNGIAITAKYETKIYDVGYPAQLKKFKFSYQFAVAQGSFTTRFYCSVDRFYYVLLASPSMAGTGNKLLGQTWTLGTDKLGAGGFVKVKIPFNNNGGNNKGTTMQVKLEAESTANTVKLREFTSHYRVKGLR